MVARRGLHFSHVAVRVGRTARKPGNPRALHLLPNLTQELHIDSDELVRAADIDVEPITRIMLEFGMDPVTPPPPSPETMHELAAHAARYMNMADEDAEYLAQHETACAAAWAELQESPRVLDIGTYDLVRASGCAPDEYLAAADALLEELTDEIGRKEEVGELSIEERVKRIHYATAAHEVFGEFKVHLPYRHYHEVYHIWALRAGELMKSSTTAAK
ncbi:hypothetical protein C8Q76DRAFT_696896 [Earliella scabrosa]|nr:hypothetical protein C8Q76DRAFT_696896 [Earliella scabrosa]